MVNPDKAVPLEVVGLGEVAYDGADMALPLPDNVVPISGFWHDPATGTLIPVEPSQFSQPVPIGSGEVSYQTADPVIGRKAKLTIEHDDDLALDAFGRHITDAIAKANREIRGLPPLEDPRLSITTNNVYDVEIDEEPDERPPTVPLVDNGLKAGDEVTEAEVIEPASTAAAAQPKLTKDEPVTTPKTTASDGRRRRLPAERLSRASLVKRPAKTKPVAAEVLTSELSRGRRAALNTAIGAAILCVPMEGSFWLMTKDHKNLIGYLFALSKFGIGHIAGR